MAGTDAAQSKSHQLPTKFAIPPIAPMFRCLLVLMFLLAPCCWDSRSNFSCFSTLGKLCPFCLGSTSVCPVSPTGGSLSINFGDFWAEYCRMLSEKLICSGQGPLEQQREGIEIRECGGSAKNTIGCPLLVLLNHFLDGLPQIYVRNWLRQHWPSQSQSGSRDYVNGGGGGGGINPPK